MSTEEAPSPPPCNKSRRWFLRSLIGVGVFAAAGKGIDLLLPRTLCRSGEWHGPVTDHFDGELFFNPPEGEELTYGHGAAFRWLKDRSRRGDYPEVTKNAHTPELAPTVSGANWEVTMVNHSTMLVRLAGLNILTDPVWSDCTSPIPGIGPRRKRPVGIAWDALPRIDVCLLSHDHYDHFDVPTLKRLEERDHPLFIVPLGLQSLLRHHCGAPLRIEEKDWWESVSLPGLRITLTPARHWSKRYYTDESANRSLWCGFWLQAAEGPSIYFAGDTARTRWFTRIRERLGTPHVALLPIGAYKPEWIRANHTNPADAVQAMLDLQAPLSIACHFGTWQLANEGYQETLDDLAAALAAAHIPPHSFLTPENGQTLRGSIPPTPCHIP